MKKAILSFVFIWGFLPGLYARLSLKYPTGDHMVLQQKCSAVIWGFATEGSTISVTPSWNGRVYTVNADPDGCWEVFVNTPEAGYHPYSITVSGDGEEIIVQDVLVGEVWLASGQSNMQMPVRGFVNCPVEGSVESIAQASARDKIRMLYIHADESEEPLREVRKTEGWACASPESIPFMSAVAYYFARRLNQVLDIPIGVVAFPRGGARIESWLPKEVLSAYGTEDLSPEGMAAMTGYKRPYLFYNAMQVPLQGYTAKGFIWYQGCSNVGKHDQFAPRMEDLVSLWRENWGDRQAEMPFYMVEIAPYLYSRDGKGESGALLREAQLQCTKRIPNTALVGTNDLVASYEAGNIHPSQKKPIGERLAYLALHRDYGYETIPCYGPEAVSAKVVPGPVVTLEIELDHCPLGLDRTHEITGLEVGFKDGRWVPVETVRYAKGLMVVETDSDDIPTGIRYGWGDYEPGNLHGEGNLPLFPFRFRWEE